MREKENREVHCRSSEGSLLCAICFSSEIALLFPPGRPGTVLRQTFSRKRPESPSTQPGRLLEACSGSDTLTYGKAGRMEESRHRWASLCGGRTILAYISAIC